VLTCLATWHSSISTHCEHQWREKRLCCPALTVHMQEHNCSHDLPHSRCRTLCRAINAYPQTIYQGQYHHLLTSDTIEETGPLDNTSSWRHTWCTTGNNDNIQHILIISLQKQTTWCTHAIHHPTKLTLALYSCLSTTNYSYSQNSSISHYSCSHFLQE
jgi:hypothetical protein